MKHIDFTDAELAEKARRLAYTNATIRKQSMSMQMRCNECGKTFKAKNLNGRCPKCRGCDFEPA